jgi:hydroxymethylpyrimidine/phosphomethylpyrimidine kinase
MSARRTIPCALTIAGSDSGGGAGIQADLKTFAALDVHGTSAITCVTAQNPKGVAAIQACDPEIVRKQIEAVISEFRPVAAKTGMLFSPDIIRAVANSFRRNNAPALIVDPVMIATSGARLLKPPALATLVRELFPHALLITPNIPEAEALIGAKLKSVEDLRSAARGLQRRFGCAALVKGGHLRRAREAIDIFYDGEKELVLRAPFVKGVATHGTGCTYSAAIAAYLAHGETLPHAVQAAKKFVTQSIARSKRVGRHSVLNNFTLRRWS